MHLVQLLLPLRDNNGRPFDKSVFEGVRAELTERFGGMTAYLRSPAEGRWRDPAGAGALDDVVIVEVMCRDLDRAWWAQYRERLARELGQQELMARALCAEAL